jgi:hypothetical protein
MFAGCQDTLTAPATNKPTSWQKQHHHSLSPIYCFVRPRVRDVSQLTQNPNLCEKHSRSAVRQ